jgi:hypothetical protein
MFVVTEAAAAAIRAIFEQEGELSAAIEVRRLFPGITDNGKARECARTIAGWKPLPAAANQRTNSQTDSGVLIGCAQEPPCATRTPSSS